MKLAALQMASPDRSRSPRRARVLAWGRALLVAALVAGLDRVSKQAVESSIRPGEERSFLPGVQIVHTHNTGVAFGLLGGAQVYVTVALAALVVLLLVYFARRANRRPARPPIWLPTGLIVGGALGNVIDRLRLGSVTDFVKLPLGWPPFNLADASITIGVLLLALMLWRGDARTSA